MIEAIKKDQDKPRMDLVPAGAVLDIADVFTFGAKKYSPNNWRKGFEWSRLISSLERHIAAFKEGEDIDSESGKPHLAHAGCCVMMLQEHQRLGYGKDDRYTVDKPTKLACVTVYCPMCTRSHIFNHKHETQKYNCSCGTIFTVTYYTHSKQYETTKWPPDTAKNSFSGQHSFAMNLSVEKQSKNSDQSWYATTMKLAKTSLERPPA